MNGLKALNDAIGYIEERLTGEIDTKEAAKRAYCSEYHFQRMFSFLSGVPLAEYIRRRRLTLAAQELSEGSAKIIDVAIKYGYGSPDSFSRAFQQLHGVNPSEARAASPSLKAFPRMSFQLAIQGGEAMNYRLIDKESFRIAGLHKRVPIVFHGVNPAIAELWGQLTPELIGELKAMSNMDPRGMISASVNFGEGRMEEKGELDHYIGVATSEKASGNFATLEVQASLWAVFESVGPFPETLQTIWGRIYSEWFPSSDYEISPGPEMLWNESKDTSAPDYKSEIWIPVKKRQMT